MPTASEDIDRVARWIGATDRLVVLTGAGVSTASGIPDYRGPQGVWTRDPGAERRATIDVYVRDPDVRRRAWQIRAGGPLTGALPNPAHEALVTLERRGHLDTLVTQNVDGLHQLAGSDPDRVVEVHGNVHGARCLACGWRGPMAPVLARVRQGEPDPACTTCRGVLTTTTVAFGEPLDPAVLQRAHDATVRAEVFLAVGTSLVVHPVGLLPRTALEAGARLVIVTDGETPYDEVADVKLAADAATTLGAIVAASTA